MSKEDHILDLMNLINDNYDAEGKGILVIAIDEEAELKVTQAKGDVRIISSAFFQEMETNQEFNQLMKAFMGSYLANNPDEKKEFILGLDLIKNTPNMN